MNSVMGLREEHHHGHRDLSIDFIRGIAIILVVLGHSIQYGSGTAFFENESYYNNLLFKFIYSFHMPLFALISGYLLFSSIIRHERSTEEIVKSKFHSLVIPIVVWKTLDVIGETVTQIIQGDFSLSDFIVSYIVGLLMSNWFLWAMFLCSLIVIIVERLLKGNAWIYLALFILFLFVPSKLNPHFYIYVYPYFVIGFLAHKLKFVDYLRQIKRNYIITSVVTMIFIVMLAFYGKDMYIYTTRISLLEADNAAKQLVIDIYRWIIGLSGSFLTILICRNVYEKIKNSVLCYCIVVLGQMCSFVNDVKPGKREEFIR